MKQILLKTLALGLMVMLGVNAWADNTVRYSTDGGTNWTEAADLNALMDKDGKVFTSATSNVQVEVSGDQTLSKRLTWNKAHTLTITPTANITIKGPAGAMWFLANVNNAFLNIGSNDYTITLDGEKEDHTAGDITRREAGAGLSLTKVVFKDFNLKSACHLASATNNGNTILLENVSIVNCTNPSDAYIYSLRVANDAVVLKGYLNIDNDSPGTGIYLSTETKDSGTTGRLRVDGTFSASNAISVMYHETKAPTYPKLDVVLISSSVKQDLSDKFTAKSDNIPYIDMYYNDANDMKFRQAYTLTVTSVGAATLVLPFESTIPAGPKCYTLHYTTGSSSVSATEVETTLGANTPVLVNADEGSYKFVSTATSGSLATGSDPVTVDALTGVYAEKDVPENSYILSVRSEKLGFYKSDGTHQKVKANRAYLTAEVPAGTRGLTIDYDGSTGMRIVENNEIDSKEDVWYSLSGHRLSGAPATKGIYIKNGKKIIIK